MKIGYFETSRKDTAAAERSGQAHSRRIVFLRLVVFCLIIGLTAAGYDYSPVFYGLAFLLLLGFLRLLNLHRKISQRLLLLQSRRQILEQYIARFSKDWQSFPANGEEHLRDDRPQSLDLDLFGKASVYQYICAARTLLGRQKLAAALTPQPPAAAVIEQRQAAAAEFIADPKLAVDLQALSQLLPDNHDTRLLVEQLEQPPQPLPAWLRPAAYGLPALTIASLLLAITGNIPWIAAGLLMFLQFALSGLFYNRTADCLAPLFAFYRTLKPYEKLFAVLETQDFRSAYLQELQQQLLAGGGASRAVCRLHRLGEYANMRRNLLFYSLGNTFVLWDFHCIVQFSAWKRAAAQDVRVWLDAFGEIEMLLSLAVIGQVKEVYTFPQVLPGQEPELRATEIKHILLAEAAAVDNSIRASGETCILTGSNMSGKTTFMRTLATSAILAYAGAPVCARSFALTRMQVFTSLRVQDDISKGLSTFYAELLRIKSMVEFSRQKLPMLALIDEIFKGTNSADRIIGARAAIHKLTNPWSLTFVSTHDFELCDMADKEKLPITNYHFEEYYTGDEIHFDYRLKPGRCQSTNAQYLLKLAGILST